LTAAGLISTLLHNYCHEKQENEEGYLAIKISIYHQGTYLQLVCVSTLLHNYCHKKQENEEGYLAIKISIYHQGTYPIILKVPIYSG